MDTHIHNNYNFFFNIIIHFMVFKNYNFFRLNINNDGQPNLGNNNITPEDTENLNANNNMNILIIKIILLLIIMKKIIKKLIIKIMKIISMMILQTILTQMKMHKI